MQSLGIEFSKIFHEKHGEKIFQNIVDQIKKERIDNFSQDYIDIIFTIAFLTYFGVFDTKTIYSLGGISKNANIDINEVQKIHKNSISLIKKYIQETNEKNFEDYKKITGD